MSEKLTAKERYEADKARLAAKREENNAKHAAQKAANDARLHADLDKVRDDRDTATAEFHEDMAELKGNVKTIWAEYGADRRAGPRKEAKQAAKDSKRA